MKSVRVLSFVHEVYYCGLFESNSDRGLAFSLDGVGILNLSDMERPNGWVSWKEVEVGYVLLQKFVYNV